MNAKPRLALYKDKQPSGRYSKLKAKFFGPCEIQKKINENAYVTDLPEEFNISSTFNVSDLKKYYAPKAVELQFKIIVLGERSFDTMHISSKAAHVNQAQH